MGRGHNHAQFSPVAHIPFGEDITDVLEDWAVKKGLEYLPYYHDLPVWILHGRQPKTTVRHLQITAYLVNTELYLSLIPSVHTFVGTKKTLVPRKVIPERFAISTVLDEGGRLDKPERFLARIEEVWERTASLTFQPHELMEVTLSVPPR